MSFTKQEIEIRCPQGLHCSRSQVLGPGKNLVRSFTCRVFRLLNQNAHAHGSQTRSERSARICRPQGYRPSIACTGCAVHLRVCLFFPSAAACAYKQVQTVLSQSSGFGKPPRQWWRSLSSSSTPLRTIQRHTHITVMRVCCTPNCG